MFSNNVFSSLPIFYLDLCVYVACHTNTKTMIGFRFDVLLLLLLLLLLLQLSCHPVAVVLTLLHTKQIRIKYT